MSSRSSVGSLDVGQTGSALVNPGVVRSSPSMAQPSVSPNSLTRGSPVEAGSSRSQPLALSPQPQSPVHRNSSLLHPVTDSLLAQRRRGSLSSSPVLSVLGYPSHGTDYDGRTRESFDLTTFKLGPLPGCCWKNL